MVRAEEVADDCYAAIDLVCDKVKRKMRKVRCARCAGAAQAVLREHASCAVERTWLTKREARFAWYGWVGEGPLPDETRAGKLQRAGQNRQGEGAAAGPQPQTLCSHSRSKQLAERRADAQHGNQPRVLRPRN